MSVKSSVAPTAKDPNVLTVETDPSESKERGVARTILRPSVQAAITLHNIAPHRKDTSLGALIDELSTQCQDAIDGKLGRSEAMLVAQAHTLDTLFNRLILRAAANQGEYLDAADRYFRLALRAQNQCRATIETLAAIKNPPHLAFVKQANIGHAVQVNNGAQPLPAATTPAPETENVPNKLLEHSDGERLVPGAKTTSSYTDSGLEAVEMLNGSADKAR